MLSIIVTHYRTPVLLKSCLESIKKNIDNLEYEIIILDSQAEKEYKELVKDIFPQVKYIPFSENISNYAKLVNVGLNEIRGEYVLILNHDIVILNNAINKLLDFLEENPEVGLVGPQLLTFGNEIQDSCFRFPTIGTMAARRTFLGKTNWGKKKIDQFLMKDKDLNLPTKVDWLQGSAMMVRKEAIIKVGLWDERFNRYFEDTDWCRRFWEKRYQVVYSPIAKVSHYYGRHSKKWGGFIDIFLNKYTRMHILSFLKYLIKWRKR